MFPSLLPCAGQFCLTIADSKRLYESTEAEAVCTKGAALSDLAENLVTLTLASRASDKPSLEAEVSELGFTGWGLPAELVDDTARWHRPRVSASVGKSATGRNVHLLSSRYYNTQSKSLVTTSKDGAVAWWAGIANLFNGTVGRGAWAAEVELSATSSEGQKVDGRSAASRHDAKEACGCWRGGSCSRTWGRRRAYTCHGADDERSESDSVLHFGRRCGWSCCSECVWLADRPEVKRNSWVFVK
ncbi:hypothetical protein J1614_010519 [Plenodomus biglobosus]|nr:hypothetical protein J1614_010519 [Plenodomus biglobosus]